MSGLCECGCGVRLDALRSDARYATDACRARAWKRRTGYGAEQAAKAYRNGNPQVADMTQEERVLRALEHAGSRGITAVDFIRYPTLDGGEPITRVAARIQDLRDAGHPIVTDGVRDKCAIYKLPAVVDGASAPSPPGVPEPRPDMGAAATTAGSSLFDLPPQNALYGDEAA